MNAAIAIHPGVLFDLARPQPHLVDFADIADGLARRLRYGPLAAAVQWSVAQHTLLAVALAPDFARAHVAVHDAGEHYLGDDVTPKKRALEYFGRTPEEGAVAAAAYERMLEATDAAIHSRAGLAWPVPEAIAREVRIADRRAFNAEVSLLLPPEYRRCFTLFADVEPVAPWIVSQVARLPARAALLAEFKRLPAAFAAWPSPVSPLPAGERSPPQAAGEGVTDPHPARIERCSPPSPASGRGEGSAGLDPRLFDYGWQR